MTININPWAILFLCGIVIGMLMVIILITFLRRYNYHIQNITAVLIILIALLFSELIERVDVVEHFRFFHNYSISLDLFIWPFLLFYAQYITGHRNGYGLEDIAWFVPSIVGLIWNWMLLNTYFFILDDAAIPSAIGHFASYKFMVAIGFLSYIIVLLKKKIIVLKKLLIYLKVSHPYNRIFYFHVFLFAGILVIYAAFFNNFFQLIELPDSDDIGSLIISCILFSFSIVIFSDPQVVDPNKYSVSVKKFFDRNEYHYATELLHLMQSDRPFLNTEATPETMAKKIGLNAQQFSYLINRYLGVTFTDFINSYRVEEMKKALSQPGESKENLLQIGFACGFNSKSSMNRIFKNHTGLSPSEFLKKK